MATQKLSTFHEELIEKPTFSEAMHQLFELLLAHPDMRQMVITPRELTFTQFVLIKVSKKKVKAYEQKAIVVKTTAADIDLLQLLAFLTTPKIPFFGHPEWLDLQLDKYPASLGVFRDARDNMKLVVEKSRAT